MGRKRAQARENKHTSKAFFLPSIFFSLYAAENTALNSSMSKMAEQLGKENMAEVCIFSAHVQGPLMHIHVT